MLVHVCVIVRVINFAHVKIHADNGAYTQSFQLFSCR